MLLAKNYFFLRRPSDPWLHSLSLFRTTSAMDARWHLTDLDWLVSCWRLFWPWLTLNRSSQTWQKFCCRCRGWWAWLPSTSVPCSSWCRSGWQWIASSGPNYSCRDYWHSWRWYSRTFKLTTTNTAYRNFTRFIQGWVRSWKHQKVDLTFLGVFCYFT